MRAPVGIVGILICVIVLLRLRSRNLPCLTDRAIRSFAGIGSFAVAFFAIAADQSAFVKNLLVFYKPTGALCGETTVAILL